MMTDPNGSGTDGRRSRSLNFSGLPRHLFGRLCMLGAIAALELLACFRGEDFLFGHPRFYLIAIVSYGAFLSFGHSELKDRQENIPFGRIFFVCHLACIGAVFISTLAPLQGAGWLYSYATGYPKSAIYLVGTVCLALAFVPIQIWIKTIRSTSPLWLYASLAGVACWASGFPIRAIWMTSSTVPGRILEIITYRTLEPVLRFFLPEVVSNRATFTLGTPRFLVDLIPQCSGIEGLGLVLVFTSLWLFYCRRECRFPRALLLIPCAMGCIWLLNIVRIAALIMIGDAGSPEVAVGGFHAHAGWIAFIVVALATSLVTQRLSWMRALPSSGSGAASQSLRVAVQTMKGTSDEQGESRGEAPAIRAYLLPFLAILAASFFSKAASGNFEWLYPLRFFAAAVAICYFWPELKKLNWRFGWVGPATGVAVFLVWMAPTWWTHQAAPSPLGPALGALSPTARWAWIAFRVAAAVITVPIAEELAFRGYLTRRFISREFDSVSFTGLTALSVGLSSLVFGLMHGQHWFVGILAGLGFAGALRWRGRMGDAVVAHAISNLLLAAWVLGFGDWALW